MSVRSAAKGASQTVCNGRTALAEGGRTGQTVGEAYRANEDGMTDDPYGLPTLAEVRQRRADDGAYFTNPVETDIPDETDISDQWDQSDKTDKTDISDK